MKFSSGINHGKRKEKESKNCEQLEKSTYPFKEEEEKVTENKTMPICDLCGEQSNKVTKCKVCEEVFCADCGNAEEKVCLYCDDEDEDN